MLHNGRALRGFAVPPAADTSTSYGRVPRNAKDVGALDRCVRPQVDSGSPWYPNALSDVTGGLSRANAGVCRAVSTEAPLSSDPQHSKQDPASGNGVLHINGVSPSLRDGSVLHGRFQIPAAEVRRILRDQQVSLEELLLLLIQPAAMLARPYISGFRVGAVGVGGSGAIYVGVNVEFPNTALNNSIHAEQCLLVNCLHHKETELKLVAVSAAPCGHCRQFFSELANADTIQFMFGKNARPRLLNELLPLRFGPADLAGSSASGNGSPPFPLLLQPQENSVAFLRPDQVEDLVELRCNQEDASCCGLFHEAVSEALTEAMQSYAPYTQCPSGVAIITLDGQIYSGAYIESAAYNPSLSPFQAAIVAGIADQLHSYEQIAEVILTELHGAPVQHANGIEVVLRAIAPKASLTVLPLRRVAPTPLPSAAVLEPMAGASSSSSDHGGVTLM